MAQPVSKEEQELMTNSRSEKLDTAEILTRDAIVQSACWNLAADIIDEIQNGSIGKGYISLVNSKGIDPPSIEETVVKVAGSLAQLVQVRIGRPPVAPPNASRH